MADKIPTIVINGTTGIARGNGSGKSFPSLGVPSYPNFHSLPGYKITTLMYVHFTDI